MNNFQVTVDAQGNTIINHAAPIGEHCRSRARLLTSLVNMVCAPGAFDHFNADMKRDLLGLMHSVAQEQLPLIDALEHHTAQSYYDKGVHAALEHRRHQEQAAIAEVQQQIEQQHIEHQQADYTQR
jgi:hypothetical protein